MANELNCANSWIDPTTGTMHWRSSCTRCLKLLRRGLGRRLRLSRLLWSLGRLLRWLRLGQSRTSLLGLLRQLRRERLLRLRGARLPDDRARLRGHHGEGEGGEHENDGGNRGDLVQKGRRAPAAEERLARSAEGGPDFSSLAPLEQDDAYQEERRQYMKDDEYNRHDNLLTLQ